MSTSEWMETLKIQQFLNLIIMGDLVCIFYIFQILKK